MDDEWSQHSMDDECSQHSMDEPQQVMTLGLLMVVVVNSYCFSVFERCPLPMRVAIGWGLSARHVGIGIAHEQPSPVLGLGIVTSSRRQFRV